MRAYDRYTYFINFKRVESIQNLGEVASLVDEYRVKNIKRSRIESITATRQRISSLSKDRKDISAKHQMKLFILGFITTAAVGLVLNPTNVVVRDVTAVEERGAVST